MKQKKMAILILVLSLTPTIPAIAADISPCDGALVKATYDKFDTSSVDSRLASFVTEGDYDTIKHDAGVSAVIYGVPVGANYSDYRNKVQQKLSQTSSSLNQNEAHSVMWTGLDSSSVSAYEACLNVQVLSLPGLHLVVRNATAGDITILARWVPAYGQQSTIPISWSGIEPTEVSQLPTSLGIGAQAWSLPRPNIQHSLNINTPGASDTVTLDPLPAPLQTPTIALPNLNGRWCPQTSAPADDLYLVRNGNKVEVLTSFMGQAADVGYVNYLDEHRPPSETPLFQSREFSTDNASEFEIVDSYATVPAVGANQHVFRMTDTHFKFLGANTLRRVRGTTTDQSGLTAPLLSQSLITYQRCGDIPAKVLQPSNGAWKSSLPTIPIGIP